VQGFFQIFSVDCTNTHSPVAMFVSIRIILALCVQLGLIIHTMGVDAAFLNAELDEVIWVKIPEGTRLAVGDDGTYKQASRCWNNLINAYLIEKGFKRMKADPCLYIKEFQVDDKGVLKTQYQIVTFYVDDLIIAASTKNLLTALRH
jgi:Reverse transcriptase (RNA-dependent DNA polymerase)